MISRDTKRKLTSIRSQVLHYFVCYFVKCVEKVPFLQIKSQMVVTYECGDMEIFTIVFAMNRAGNRLHVSFSFLYYVQEERSLVAYYRPDEMYTSTCNYLYTRSPELLNKIFELLLNRQKR